jgi:hypothetical protein
MATEGSTPASGALTDIVCARIDRFQDELSWQPGESRNKLIGDIREAVRAVLILRPQSWTAEEIRKAILAETTDAMTPPFYDLANRVCKHLQFLYQPAPKTPEEPHVESSGSGTFDVRYGGKYLANFVSEIEAAHYVAALREEVRHG